MRRRHHRDRSRLGSLAVVASAACSGYSTETHPSKTAGQPPTCAIEDGRPFTPVDPFYERRIVRYRVDVATGKVTQIDPAHTAPLPNRVYATIDNGRLHVRRSEQIILDADARGARSVAWQIERDGMLFISLYGDDLQTYQALRLAAAPHVDTVWCRTASNDAPAGTRGAVATEHGPLLVRTPTQLVALRAQDGEIAWELPRTDTGAPFTVLEAGTDWITCDMDIVALDREHGTVRWRKSFPPHTPVDCGLVGSTVQFSARTCTTQQCTPSGDGALELATGSATAVDRRPSPAATFASKLDPHRRHLAQYVIAVRDDLAKGSSALAVTDTALGSERLISLPAFPRLANIPGGYEVGGAMLLGSAGTEIDVAVSFGYLER
jgi:hypothetical protein